MPVNEETTDRAVSRSVAIIGTRGYPSYYGGFETAVRHLAPYLADHGWDVTVYGRAGTPEDPPGRDERVRSVTTRGVESKSLSTLSYGLSSCLDAARRRPDVALVMNVANGYWLPLLRSRRIPTLVNVDGIEWERSKWGRLARGVFRGGARMTARWADEIACDAEEIARRWSVEFGRTGLFVPYGGDPTPDSPRAPLGLTSGAYVLYVARFVPENSFWEFLEAARRLAQDRDVVIVGSSGYGGSTDDAVRELADTSPRVQWLGHVSDDALLASLWAHAGAYVHGHSVGGTNPALVQAMWSGAPIVARDTVFNREVLGSTGVFCSPNPDAIIDAVRSVLTNPELRADLSARTRSRAEERYTWEGVCGAYESALTRLRSSRS